MNPRVSNFPHPGVVLVGLSLLMSACQGAPAPAASSEIATAPARPATPSAPPVKSSDALAAQTTNWRDTVAEVTEFRRKGNTLTAIVRLRNHGKNTVVIQVTWGEAYVLDEPHAKKYAVLKDEKDVYIATPYVTEGLVGDGTMTFWMKFPAPPGDVKSATLAVPQIPPFEDLQIQDR
jgi:hypothetical protein